MTQVDPVFTALADPSRRQIVEMLSGGDAMSVSEIADHFEMSRQAIAKHLRVLRQADVIHGEHRGREHLHMLVPEQMAVLANWVDHYGRFWDTKLATLKTLAERDHKNECD